MQLILEANDISLSTAHFSELNRSRRKIIYAKPRLILIKIVSVAFYAYVSD